MGISFFLYLSPFLYTDEVPSDEAPAIVSSDGEEIPSIAHQG